MAPLNPDASVIALDVGERRIGVAIARLVSRLPQPQGVIMQSKDTLADIGRLVEAEAATALVVGLPRGLDGQETAQTKLAREFGAQLESTISIPLYFQDEALTSKLAQQELKDRGVEYNKEDVDALAATYILRDYLGQHPEFK